MSFSQSGSSAPPQLLVYGNAWAMTELPQQPSAERWSFEQGLEKLVKAGFDGYQAPPDKADLIRSFGLRFASSGRISLPGEAEPLIARAAQAGADALTAHLGWGMESDEEMDVLISTVLEASAKHALPVYPETHRATIFQDIWRTCGAIERFPELRFNGDFSHYYCGQEMGYRGFSVTKDYLIPILDRTRFLHGRISDGQAMQIDLSDPASRVHLERFSELWRSVFQTWLAQAQPGEAFIFTPELGPPSSGYSLTRPHPGGERMELADRWRDTLELKQAARQIFQTCLPV